NEQADPLHRTLEHFALDRDPVVRLTGDDLAKIRIVALDQFGDEKTAIELKTCLAVGDRDLELARIFEEPLQFVDRLGRDDDTRLIPRGELEILLDHGETTTVGRDEGEHPLPDDAVDPVEDI